MKLKTIGKKLLREKFLGFIDYYRFPKGRNSWGGPFNGQTFRQAIFLELIQKITFSTIVETGTFRGTTTEYLYESSRLPVHTVEYNLRLYGYSRARFFMHKSIKTYHDDSRSFLIRFMTKKEFRKQKVFYYLDAHWGEDLPLKKEIQVIFEHCPHAVVMVDDFQVPGDKGYGFDDYGEGNVLNLGLLNSIRNKLGIVAFFPSQSSDYETGARRGCVVLATDPDLVEILRKVKTLKGV